ncbi:MAG: adenylate/guanylate cyclase domain-containing protein [Verrucomicrobiota bacterium]
MEIAHLLLIDVVGYSKLLVNEQIEYLQKLHEIVRSTECFREAEKSGKLMRLPTGDGMALLFFQSPEEPVRCALAIAEELKNHQHIQLRMGVHSGPVSQVRDVNETINVAGAGINVAQRVMDCGDAGHILLSKHVAEDLAQYRKWQPHLRDLGECEVKHGLRLHLYNLCKGDVGNPNVPAKLKRRALWKSHDQVRPIRKTLGPIWAFAVAFLFFAAAGAAFYFFSHRAPLSGGLVAPEKSIAVLPFENLSNEKENAYFADGVQDEILSDLAKVADLKVISRTSVMHYRTDARRNLREIAQALGVAYILEGSVQRAANRVKVITQLIDARTDRHVWSHKYERGLEDVFAIQTEMAEKIVAELQSKLSPAEKAAIEEPPTSNLPAYDLYVKAKALIFNSVYNEPGQVLFEAVHLLDETVKRDPSFFLAYCQLVLAHDQIYLRGIDHTPARLALGDAALQSVRRLRPDSGEAHLALAGHLYWGHLDYDRARGELEAAQRLLPNDPLPFLLAAYIDRRQGRWEQSTHNMEHALELDPRNLLVLQQMSLNYESLRRYSDMTAVLDRALAVAPEQIGLRLQRATIDLDWRADSKPLHAAIDSNLAEKAGTTPYIAESLLYLALCERDADAATRALSVMSADGCDRDGIPFSIGWCQGVAARAKGDADAAHAAFTKARNEVSKIVHDQPNYAKAVCALGMIDAALGRKKEAIEEGRRAVELLPVSKDSIDGALLVQHLAIIYAASGKKDAAFEQLSAAAKLPGYLSYGQLRLHPYWDPLRGDPRFEEIVASLAPK